MPAIAKLVVTAAMFSAPMAAFEPAPPGQIVHVNMFGDGALGDAIEQAVSGGSVGQGNGNGNGNVGDGNGNNNSGNNNGNNNTGNNNGNNNSGDDNGNDNTGNDNGNNNSGSGNGNRNVGDGFGNDNSTNGNGNDNAASGSVIVVSPGVTRDLGPGSSAGGAPPAGATVCQRVRFLWMTELRCN